MKKTVLIYAVVFLTTCLVIPSSCVTKEVAVTETYYETEYRVETHFEIQDTVIGQECGDDAMNWILQWHAPTLTMTSNFLGLTQIECDGLWYFGYEIPDHDTTGIKVTLCKSFPGKLGFAYTAHAYDLGEDGQIAPPPGGQWVPDPQKIGYYKWGDFPWSHNLADWITMANSRLSSARYLGQWKAWDFSIHRGVVEASNIFEFDANGVTNLGIIVCGANFEWEPVQAVNVKWCDDVTEKRKITKQVQVPYRVEKQRTVMETNRVPFWELIFRQ